jgi:hypothetical protein
LFQLQDNLYPVIERIAERDSIPVPHNWALSKTVIENTSAYNYVPNNRRRDITNQEKNFELQEEHIPRNTQSHTPGRISIISRDLPQRTQSRSNSENYHPGHLLILESREDLNARVSKLEEKMGVVEKILSSMTAILNRIDQKLNIE